MTLFARRTVSLKRAGSATFVLAALSGAAAALPQMAGAQVAGGSEAGGGAPVVNSALLDPPILPPEVPRCIHRVTDDRPSTHSDDKRLTVWLSVRRPMAAAIKVRGYATGVGTGSLSITMLSDGIPIASSQEVRGTSSVTAQTSASVALVPGRQYKITATPSARNKTLGVFDMDVAVGRTCP